MVSYERAEGLVDTGGDRTSDGETGAGSSTRRSMSLHFEVLLPVFTWNSGFHTYQEDRYDLSGSNLSK